MTLKSDIIEFTMYEQIKAFVYLHQEVKCLDEADEVISTLLKLKDEWKKYYQCLESNLFVDIFQTLSRAYNFKKDYKSAFSVIQECLNTIENANEYQYLFNLKADLYHNKAYYLVKLGAMDDDILEALKYEIYYEFQCHNHEHYDNFDFCGFKPISNYLINDIKNNTISLCSPLEFNDPIDSAYFPIIDLMIMNSNDEDEKRFLTLQKKAFAKVRARCMMRTLPLPNKEGRDIDKQPENDKEYNVTTMWSHYANNHQGVCLRYRLPAKLTSQYNNGKLLMLKAINYVNSVQPTFEGLNFTQAFFTKSKFWEYEHEHRLLYYALDDDSEHPTILLPNDSLQAIYLGLKISDENKRKILDSIPRESRVEVYQMVLSMENIYQLKPLKIDRMTGAFVD